MVVGILAVVVNVVLWTLLFLYLKKKLSPDGIVREARKELEAILLQINGATDRDIRLLQAQLGRLKDASRSAEELCSEAEKRIAMLYGELDRAASVRALEGQAYASESQTEGAGGPEGSGSMSVSEPVLAALPRDDTLNKSYSPLDSYRKEQQRFVPEGGGAGEVLDGGASPVTGKPEFVQAEVPIEVKKNFKQRVMEMRTLGYTIEEIAHETGRSIQEVKITIEIS